MFLNLDLCIRIESLQLQELSLHQNEVRSANNDTLGPYWPNMVKKVAGRFAGAAANAAKKATKGATDTVKRQVVDEITKPAKDAIKAKVDSATSALKDKADEKVREVVAGQMKKEAKKKLFGKR